MASEKMDRRKKYTRMVLKQSLMDLLKKKQISTITVKEVCALADINRSTFYAHYFDHYDLLEQIEEELIEDLTMYLNSYNFEKEEEAFQMTEKLIDYFAAKQEECQTLLSDNSDSSFEQKVRHVARKYMMTNREEIAYQDEDISEYVSSFIIGGSIAVMKEWLLNDMNKTSKEIAGIITNLANKGISKPL